MVTAEAQASSDYVVLLRTVTVCDLQLTFTVTLYLLWLLTCRMNVSLLFVQTHPSGICLQAQLDVGGEFCSHALCMLSAHCYPTLLKRVKK